MKTSWERVVREGELAEAIRVARLLEVVLAIRLMLIRFELSCEHKPSRLIRFTFYSHAQWCIRDKESFPTIPLQALWGLTIAHRRQKQGKFTVFTGLVIVEALPSLA